MKTVTKIAAGIGYGLLGLVGAHYISYNPHYISYNPVHQEVRVQTYNNHKTNKPFQKKTVNRIFNKKNFEYEFDGPKRNALDDFEDPRRKRELMRKRATELIILLRNQRLNIIRNSRRTSQLILQKYLQKSNLSRNINSQLRTIIKKQYQKNRIGEVGGSIFLKNNSLELRVVEPSEKKMLIKAFQDFKKGNYKKTYLLARSTKFIYEAGLIKTPRNHPKMRTIAIMDSVFIAAILNKMNLVHQKRKNIVTFNNYKNLVLNHMYSVNYKELGVGQKGFIGIFHVHDSGIPPSHRDVKITRGTSYVDLVISPQKNFKNNRVKLYLVNNGRFKMLYNGFLNSKN